MEIIEESYNESLTAQWAIVVVAIAIFIINPFIGMTLYMLFRLVVNKKNKILDALIPVLVVGFICLVQMTANAYESETDWMNYIYNFNEVRNVSFGDFVSKIYKEPLWSIIEYVSYHILAGNGSAFVKLISIITFLLMGYSIYRYWNYTETSSSVLVAMLALLFFFKEYIGSVDNLLRMFFAFSILTLGFVKKIETGRIPWLIFICAVFIHTFCALFVMISFVKPLYEKMRLKHIGYFVVVGVFVLLGLSRISFFQEILSDYDTLSYGFDRLSEATNPFDKNRLNETTVFFNALIVVSICVFMNYFTQPLPENLYYTNMLFVSMILCSLIATTTPEIMGRLYVSRFVIFPFVFPFFMARNKTINSVVTIGISIFFFLRFCNGFDTICGGSLYPNFSELITYSLVSFLYQVI